MANPIPIEQAQFDEGPKPVPIEQAQFDKGYLDRAGDLALKTWDAARGAVKAIGDTAAGEVDVSNIVSLPPGPAGMFNAEKTMVSGPAVPDNLIPSHITMQDRAAFAEGGRIAAGAPEDLKTLEASHVLSPTAAISTDTTPKPGIAARIFRPSDTLTPEAKNRATDIITLSRMTKLPPSVVEKNFDAVAKEVGARGTPTLNEMATFMMTPAIAAGLATNPLMTITALAGFEATKEAESLAVQAVQGKPMKFRAGAEVKDLLGPLNEPFTVATDAIEVVLPGFIVGGGFKGARAILGEKMYGKPYVRPLSEVLQTEVQNGRLSPQEAASVATAAQATGDRFGLAFADRNTLGTMLGADLTQYLGTVRRAGALKLGPGPGPEPPPGLPPGPTPPPGPHELTTGGPLGTPMPERFPMKEGVGYSREVPGPRMLNEAPGVGIWNQATSPGRPGVVIRPGVKIKGKPGEVWVAPPSNLPPGPPPDGGNGGGGTPILAPGAPITQEAIPTPPPAPEATVAPETAPGTPEFYKAEAAKLPGTVRYIGDQMGYPMFNDDTMAGSFVVNPGETVTQALERAQSRYKAVPEPEKLSTGIPQGIPQAETPGDKFAQVRKEKTKAKKEAAEPTLQQRILRAGGIKIDPAMRGEFAQYGLRQGEGALARLYRSEKHPGYKQARGWDQWVETLIEDGTLPKGAGISDLFEAIKKNKRPGTEIADEEFARSAAESDAKAARETVPENEIALGDSFRIDGEKFKAVRYNEKGNLIVKDGREIEVEANTGLQVDGGKEGVTPGEIPKVAEKAPKGQQDLIEDKSFKLSEQPPPEGPAGEFKPSAAGAQDELFPGERAKYRAPEKGAPAPPPEGGLFGAPTKKGILDNEHGELNLEYLAAALEAGDNVRLGARKLLHPTGISPQHLHAAEVLSHKVGRLNRRASIETLMFRKNWKMFERLGVHKKDMPSDQNPGHQFMSDKSMGRKMSPEMQKISDKMDVIERDDIRRLEAAGAPLGKVRENYFAGMWKDKTAAEKFLAKRPFKGSESFRKAKVFEDWMDGIKAGLEPVSSNPIDIFLLKRMEVNRSIMANEALREWEAEGSIKFNSIFKKIPEEFQKIDDKYGTVYGPPHVALEEFVDEHIYEGLLKIAGSLGIKHERKISAGRSKLGWAQQSTQEIVTQFATETKVLAHEIGHQLDFKYGLWDKIVTQAEGIGAKGEVTKAASQKKRGTVQRELRALADLTWEGQQASAGYKAKVREKVEKMAHLLEAYIHAPERFKDVAPTVYESFNSFLRAMPELKAFTAVKPGLALTRITAQKNLPGPVLIGYRIAKTPVADILKNYLSQSLYNNPYMGLIYKGVMGTANLLNQTQLGVFSGFHAGFTSFEVQISAGANILKDIYGVANGNRSLGQLGDTLKNWPTAMGNTARLGSKLLKEWNNPGSQGGKIAQIAEAAELAGANFSLERGLKTQQADKMYRDWFSGNKVRAAARSPIALIELGAKPIMEWLVPRQKAGVFAELAGRIIEQNPGVPLVDLRSEFSAAWDQVDARLGQVAYQRLFMNNAAKNVIQATIRAPGWTGGTIWLVGGSPKDTFNFFREWATTGKAPKDMPDRVAYTMSLLLTTALANGLLTLAFTGDMPEGMDYWAFRDGGTDEYGKPSRFILPTYAKDVYAWYKKPKHTAVAKIHPAISTELEIQRGTDYYGTQIANPEDSWAMQQIDNMKHRAKAFVPFWMRGMAKVVEREGGVKEAIKSPLKSLAPLVGIMPATSMYTRTEAEKLMGEMGQARRPLGGSTKEQSAYANLRTRTLRLLRLGKTFDELPADIQEGLNKLPEDRLLAIEDEAQSTWLISRFKRRTVDEKLQVWKVMTTAERSEVEDIFWDSIDAHYNKLDDEDKPAFETKVERANREAKKAAAK